MTLKTAVIGTGRIATMKLLPALRNASGASLWSVLSRDASRAAEVAGEFGAESATPGYDNLDAMLADPELDAVIIATPDKLHAEQAIAAARAGKHVFCEKPMTTSLAEADAMIDACDSAGVKLGVAFHLRWHAGHRKLFEATQNGLLGELRHIRVQWSAQAADAANWRAESEVGKWWSLAGVGTHCLDQVLWFMQPTCGKVVDVQSIVSREVWNGPNDESALIALKFESGATAQICSSVVFDGPNQFELYGASGYARGEDSVSITGEGRMWTHEGDWDYTPVDPYQLEIEDFAAAVRDDRAPEVDGQMGRLNTEILLRVADP
jgi:predicted dehydrogenase